MWNPKNPGLPGWIRGGVVVSGRRQPARDEVKAASSVSTRCCPQDAATGPSVVPDAHGLRLVETSTSSNSETRRRGRLCFLLQGRPGMLPIPGAAKPTSGGRLLDALRETGWRNTRCSTRQMGCCRLCRGRRSRRRAGRDGCHRRNRRGSGDGALIHRSGRQPDGRGANALDEISSGRSEPMDRDGAGNREDRRADEGGDESPEGSERYWTQFPDLRPTLRRSAARV